MAGHHLNSCWKILSVMVLFFLIIFLFCLVCQKPLVREQIMAFEAYICKNKTENQTNKTSQIRPWVLTFSWLISEYLQVCVWRPFAYSNTAGKLWPSHKSESLRRIYFSSVMKFHCYLYRLTPMDGVRRRGQVDGFGRGACVVCLTPLFEML